MLSYIEAYRIDSTALAADPTDVVAQVMLSKFDPARLVLSRQPSIGRGASPNQLKRGMFRDGATPRQPQSAAGPKALAFSQSDDLLE